MIPAEPIKIRTMARSVPSTLTSEGISPRSVLAGIGGLAILIGPLVFFSHWVIAAIFSDQRVGPAILPSISHAFHSPIAKPFFIGMLSAAALMFMAYRGWTARSPGADRALAVLCSLAGCMVVLFPTVPQPMPPTGNSELWPDYAKAFQVVHFSAAATLFISLILIARCRFTDDSDGDEHYRAWKRVRNGVYRCCSNIMIGAVVGMVACWIAERVLRIELLFPYVLIGEWLALTAFGIAWLVKGRLLFAYSGGVFAMPFDYAERSTKHTENIVNRWLSNRPQTCSICTRINALLDAFYSILQRFRGAAN